MSIRVFVRVASWTALGMLLTACELEGEWGEGGGWGSSSGGSARANPNASSHEDDQRGVFHGMGKDNPLVNCTSCHGPTLDGADGPSCYSCHDNADHSRSQDGVRHRSGSNGSCQTCHGPGNSGGLGPACSRCHG